MALHGAKGICLDNLKRGQEALAEYRKTLEINPKIRIKPRLSQLSKNFNVNLHVQIKQTQGSSVVSPAAPCSTDQSTFRVARHDT